MAHPDDADDHKDRDDQDWLEVPHVDPDLVLDEDETGEGKTDGDEVGLVSGTTRSPERPPILNDLDGTPLENPSG